MSAALPRVRTALQINMHPFDVRHVIETLPHQLRVWGGQVERVCITLDTRVAKAGRYHAGTYVQAREDILAVLQSLSACHPHIVIDEVDYQANTRSQIEETFFTQCPDWPDRAFDGGPFLVYFHGLVRANADFVLHMDSDMLFGGGSSLWMEEAISVLTNQPDVLFICPFSGPPLAGGGLDGQLHTSFPGRPGIAAPRRLTQSPPSYRFETVSTRVFLIDMTRFPHSIGSLFLVQPDLQRRLRARVLAESPKSMPAEEVLSANMGAHDLSRIDWLGTGAGMFSLHPPYRSSEFYKALPALIARIENGDIPEGQRGDFDINASMIDWSSALRAKRWPGRLRKAAVQVAAVQLDRLRAVAAKST